MNTNFPRSRDFAIDLLNAETESEVTEVINKIESQTEVTWKPHGTEQNYSIVYSNTPDPIASFAELVTNSIDAILGKKYKQAYGEEYDASTGIITAEDAVENLFSDDINEEIEVIADGQPDRAPNLIVRDTGSGQPKDEFEDRFLALASGGQFKDEWPFMQGRFKMGGGAVLPHSGEKGYKLILSASHNEPEDWSWSVVRDNPEEGRFEYLQLNEDVPGFSGKVRGQDSGTFVKVFEYQWGSTMHILVQNGLREKLDRVLIDPAIPYKIREDRDKSAKVTEVNTQGMFGRFNHWNVKPIIKIDEYFHWDFGDPFGMRDIRVVVFKDDVTIKESEELDKSQKREFVAGEKHREQAVMYLVNGQTHSYERSTFITGSRGAQLAQTGEDTLVFMDLSDFADKERHDRRDFLELFSPSRDRMGGSEIAEQLQDELIKALKDFEPLQEEEDWRRRRITKRQQKDRKLDILESILKKNSGIRRFFHTGDHLRVPGIEDPEPEEYEADFFPNKFKIVKRRRNDGSVELWDESKGRFTKRQPINRQAQIQFKLDAPNDYFDRDKEPGELRVDGANPSSYNLYQGILTLRLHPPDRGKPGDSTLVNVTVRRGPMEPLSNEFEMKYRGKQEKQDGGDDSESESSSEGLAVPDPIPVYEDGENVTTWEEMGWTEDDIVEINERGEELDIFINMDAGPVKHFITRHNLTESGKETVREVWRVGVMLYSMSQYVELNKYAENREDVPAPEEIIPLTMQGIAQSLLDQHIPREELSIDNLTF